MQNTSLDHVAHQLANKDACGRTIDYMRIAITDRCNYRCVYCMPASGVPDKGHCEIMSFEEIEREFDGQGYGVFKPAVGEAVVSMLKPIQEETKRLLADKAYLQEVCRQGAERAGYAAEKTLRKVYKKVGFAAK